ncbi:acyl-CoA thioesterase [Microbacter margulisiae]|uniref:Acyl-CoA thioester hydrolase n=1 Tax=Microbacter margulisiae TaxID=1350067 RepID=A0A7W5DS59_9PORP|nr:thioesterase family protein [Microbacter margulisiae]MBB3187614.1 acyl-CoA thioester hydrolase [Microbacter margulisiae]
MITYNYQFRVAYPDTDQMGTMHHANYVKYYELARWELLRNIGVSYDSVEKQGVMCPVITMHFRFIKPTRYDELLTVKTTLKKLKGVRMWFTYELFNEKNELINEAETELAFVGRDNWKPCPPPDFLVKAIQAKTGSDK